MQMDDQINQLDLEVPSVDIALWTLKIRAHN